MDSSNNNNNRNTSTAATEQRTFCIENPLDVSNILFDRNPTATATATATGAAGRKQQPPQHGLSRRKSLEPFVGPIQVVVRAAAPAAPAPAAPAAVDNKKNSNMHNNAHVTTSVSVVHGRGVVATRQIQAGELLFATSPCIHADVRTVKRLWKQRVRRRYTNTNSSMDQEHSSSTQQQQQYSSSSSSSSLLEACTEEVLVRAMQQAPKDVVASFMCLVGSSSSTGGTSSLTVPLLNVLNVVPNGGASSIQDGRGEKEPNTNTLTPTTARDELLRVIRRNAFGPDGLQSYEYVERMWRSEQEQQQQQRESCQKGAKAKSDDSHDDDDDDDDDSYLPPRLLGIYPLAAMLNHSCLANAVRVYAGGDVGDVMLVHASSEISPEQEVVWSYLPPTLPYAQRLQTLQNLHGFTCTCSRCAVEQAAYQTIENIAARLQAMDDSLNQQHHRPTTDQNDNDNQYQQQQQLVCSAIALLENDILPDAALSNEMRRYLRVGYTQLYIRHVNAELASLSTTTGSSTAEAAANNKRRYEELLMLCMQLHFSFCACHNASTEHLSILHTCYDLVSVIYRDSPLPDERSKKLLFWTEQLKRAHMIRYGSLGNDLERVRKVLQHSRTVLRSRAGIH